MRYRVFGFLALLFVVSTGYIFAFATPSIFYMGNVLLHLVLGAALALAAGVIAWRRPTLSRLTKSGTAIFILCGMAGLYLAAAGATRPHAPVLWLHIVLGAIALTIAMCAFPSWRALQLAAALALMLQGFRWTASSAQIANPRVVPISMEEEGAGPRSPFWPSSSNTNVNRINPSNFFMDSKL